MFPAHTCRKTGERRTMLLRKLEKGDFDKGFFEVLGKLTVVGDVSKKDFEERFTEINNNPVYQIIVIELDGKIVGTTTLLLEQKFVHSCGIVGHIEDVVTKNGYEGRGIGSALVKYAIAFAEASGCYKVILDCSNENVLFYEKFDFKKKENQMRLDLF